MDVLRLLSLIVVGTVEIGLALSAYLRNSRGTVNRSFAAAVTAIVCWQSLSFMSDQKVFSAQALLLNRLTLAMGVMMAVLLVNFALVFPRPEGPLANGWRAFLGSGLLIVALTAATPLFVAGVGFRESGTDVLSGPLLPVMAVWCAAAIVCIVTVLTRRFRRVTGRLKAQLKFMLLGLGLFTVTALFFALLLPMATGSYEFSFLNTFTSLFLVGFTAYAIVKHRLMDIQLVVLRGAAYTLLVSAWGGLIALALALIRRRFSMPASPEADGLFFITMVGALFTFQPARRTLETQTDRFFYRRRYDPQRLLGELNAQMASTLELHELAGLITGTLTREMKLSHAVVLHVGAPGPVIAGTSEPLPKQSVREVLSLCETGDILFADDLEPGSDAERILAEHDAKALLPLLIENTVIGALLLGGRRSGEAFTTLDVGFLRILAPEAAIAIKNAELFHERSERVKELTALNRLAFALGANAEPDSILDAGLEQILAVTRSDSGSIMLLDEEGTTLSIKAAKGIPDHVVSETRIPIGEGVAGRVAQSKEALVLTDVDDDGFPSGPERGEIVSSMCVPLVWKNKVIGVLCINRRDYAEPFSEENVSVVTSFAGQLAVTVANAKLSGDLQSTFLGTITALAATVDAKDPYTFGHSTAVTAHAVAVAERLGLGESETRTIRVAATLHDIGKIGIEGAILHKPGPLDERERTIINSHPAIGANILASLDFLQEVVPIVLFHHERYGGGGYPSGLGGEAIPLGARIIAVADSFNAMTSDRPYRNALPLETAIHELEVNAGTQFDPAVVDAFLPVLADESHGVAVRQQRRPRSPRVNPSANGLT